MDHSAAKTRGRTKAVAIAFLLFTVYLFYSLIKLQVIGYDYYRDKVYDQITTSSPLRAERGNIYDRNMNVLATTNTVWRVFVSTRDIKKAEKESKKNYSEIISAGLSEILASDRSALLEKIRSIIKGIVTPI